MTNISLLHTIAVVCTTKQFLIFLLFTSSDVIKYCLMIEYTEHIMGSKLSELKARF